jgi:allophanate hydrolase
LAGQSIDIEVWEIPIARFGEIVAEVPAPLGIGNLQLEDGTWVKGFICENYAINDALTSVIWVAGELIYSHCNKTHRHLK